MEKKKKSVKDRRYKKKKKGFDKQRIKMEGKEGRNMMKVN